jgi:hypothetical protein
MFSSKRSPAILPCLPLKSILFGCQISEKKLERVPMLGERAKRYRLSYWGLFIGSYDTAKEALESYKVHEEIRPRIDPKKKGDYSIRDGTEKITPVELRKRAEKEQTRCDRC